MRALTVLYGYIRLLVVVVHNIYHIPSYLFINWVLLLPLKLIAPKLYHKAETLLYNWCLYTVSSWSWLAGIYVYNVGAPLPDPNRQNGKKPVKLCIVGNHQSTGDVPLLMYKLTGNPEFILMWIMSAEFKYSNFGPVSLTHEDYFINQRRFAKGDLVKHCLSLGDQRKNCFILFPEGGFRYKRLLKSNEFAAKNNLPVLNRVVWPRYGAFEELLDERIGVTHVVDLTILYCDQEQPITIFDIVKGIRPEPVYMLFRVYELTDGDTSTTNNISSNITSTSSSSSSRPPSETKDSIGASSTPLFSGSQSISTGIATSANLVYKLDRNKINLEWLRNLWKEKEQILDEFYKDKESFFANYGPPRRVDLNLTKIFAIHIFYLSATILISCGFFFLYKLYSAKIIQ